jgi:hypothetical protein
MTPAMVMSATKPATEIMVRENLSEAKDEARKTHEEG